MASWGSPILCPPPCPNLWDPRKVFIFSQISKVFGNSRLATCHLGDTEPPGAPIQEVRRLEPRNVV